MNVGAADPDLITATGDRLTGSAAATVSGRRFRGGRAAAAAAAAGVLPPGPGGGLGLRAPDRRRATGIVNPASHSLAGWPGLGPGPPADECRGPESQCQ